MGKKAPSRDGLGRALQKRRAKEKVEAASAGRGVGADGSRPAPVPLQSILDATNLDEVMENVSRRETHVLDGGPLSTPSVVVVAGRAARGNPAAAARRASRLDATQLRIPRRPAWDESTSAGALEEAEAKAFLEWRRGIALVEDGLAKEAGFGGVMITPFEKNIHVWRQLWRVVERSDVVVQIVDARNPLLYYCPDLKRYAVDEMQREHVLLVNKADLLSSAMITRWEAYFKEKGLKAYFFSAFAAANEDEPSGDHRVMGTVALIETLAGFERTTPQTRPDQRLTIGFTGYPNVGKSSTINVLLETAAAAEAAMLDASADAEAALVAGVARLNPAEAPVASAFNTAVESSTVLGFSSAAAKRVGVSSTPGKTKHFQTLVLSDDVMLCDCPGLVFPNFSASKSELICAGVLPIDQMRGDAISPVSLMARRVPAALWEGVYGIRFPPEDPGGLMDAETTVQPGLVSPVNLLSTHARARGFMTDHNRPDLFRSARALLKHYVAGRIMFAHAPPPAGVDQGEPGVGPDIISKKGSLIAAREEASAVALGVSSGAAVAAGGMENSAVKVPRANVGNVGPKAPHVPAGTGEMPSGARVRRGKKHAPQAFTRVERNFYPDPNS